MNDVFYLKDEWRVSFQGRIIKGGWQEKGPAEACLDLLEKGLGVVTDSRVVRWTIPKSVAGSRGSLVKT